MAVKIKIKRVYEPSAPQDGLRVLVDRVWPRGLSKEQVKADLWLKEIAPSTALRKWFNHDPSLWTDFKRRYFAELDQTPQEVQRLLAASADHETLTLLYSAKDETHNQAAALREYLLEKIEAR